MGERRQKIILYIHKDNGILFRNKKGNLGICETCIHFEGNMLNKIREKDKYYNPYMWNLKKK